MGKIYSGGTSDWLIFDTARNTYNVSSNQLKANRDYAENGGFGLQDIDILSNGFKLKNSGYMNEAGAGYVWAAFAESPFGLNNRAR